MQGFTADVQQLQTLLQHMTAGTSGSIDGATLIYLRDSGQQSQAGLPWQATQQQDQVDILQLIKVRIVPFYRCAAM